MTALQFEREFGAPPWTKEGYELSEKFNPARLVGKWNVPMLIVHGSKDYRLPDTEGISAFQALQRCAFIDVIVLVFTLRVTVDAGSSRAS